MLRGRQVGCVDGHDVAAATQLVELDLGEPELVGVERREVRVVDEHVGLAAAQRCPAAAVRRSGSPRGSVRSARIKPDPRTPLAGLYLVGCDAGGRGAGTHQAAPRVVRFGVVGRVVGGAGVSRVIPCGYG